MVTVHGETWTQATLLQRNLGGRDDQSTAFPPHRVVGNVYYVGTNSLATFLVVTPEGHIPINTTYERNVPMIQKSVEAARIQVLGHQDGARQPRPSDHMEGDATVKQ